MYFRKFLILVFVLTCGASCALAQDSFTDKFEITPFVGTKFGGKINVAENTTNSDVYNLPIKSSIDYGAILDYYIWPSFSIEFLWNRQPTTIGEQSLNANGFPMTQWVTNSDLDTYDFGASYSFRGESKVRPFVAAGIGWTNFTNIDNANPNNPNAIYLGFYNRLSYNVGGGVKYYFNRFLGLRLDVRYMPTRTTPGEGEECTFEGCFETQTTNHANQGSANLGVIVKF
jgi:outer membrane protein W